MSYITDKAKERYGEDFFRICGQYGGELIVKRYGKEHMKKIAQQGGIAKERNRRLRAMANGRVADGEAE